MSLLGTSSDESEWASDSDTDYYSPSHNTQGNNDTRAIKAMSKVFGTFLLRKKILSLVITSAGSTPKDICSVRLVQKVWLRNAAEILYDSGRPFFRLSLAENNSIENGMGSLDNFVSTMKNTIFYAPPLHLKIHKDFFQEENHQSFSNFIMSGKWAVALAALEITIPKNGGSMTFLFPEPMNFPILKSITLIFSKENVSPEKKERSKKGGCNGSNSNFIPFIQSILNGTKTLAEFKLKSTRSRKTNLVPTGIKHLLLPSSLKEISLNCPLLNGNEMKMLVKNSFPNLIRLDLENSSINITLADDILFQVLDNVKATLRQLYVRGLWHVPSKESPFQLPALKCLETFTSVELAAQGSPTQVYLPKLKHLELKVLTGTGLPKFTDGSCFSNVSYVKLDWFHMKKAFTVKEMQLVHCAFPKLKSFSFSGEQIEMESLQYLFREMTELTELRIGFVYSFCFGRVSSDPWDSTLIGAPVSTLAVLKSNPDFRGYIDLKPNSKMPSIRNLTALRKLELFTATLYPRFSSKPSLISDLVFDYAILQMPSLKTVVLAGAFLPSASMRARLNYLNSREDLDVLYVCYCGHL